MRISQPGLVLTLLLLEATTAAAAPCPDKNRGTLLRALLLVLALLPGPALAQEYFGAIAYSRSDRAHGWAKDYPSRDEAEKAAVANCQKHGRDCLAVLWFKNACGALATGPKGGGWAWAKTQTLADNAAINACAKHSNACVVTQRVCTTR